MKLNRGKAANLFENLQQMKGWRLGTTQGGVTRVFVTLLEEYTRVLA